MIRHTVGSRVTKWLVWVGLVWAGVWFLPGTLDKLDETAKRFTGATITWAFVADFIVSMTVLAASLVVVYGVLALVAMFAWRHVGGKEIQLLRRDVNILKEDADVLKGDMAKIKEHLGIE